mmetsp:Transcript_22767/g.43658  ORF Transcript_22767/g.43658 Transcript_22767/m.43658 type:complete len:878 (+) Transcript_22767:47-2680(+)
MEGTLRQRKLAKAAGTSAVGTSVKNAARRRRHGTVPPALVRTPGAAWAADGTETAGRRVRTSGWRSSSRRNGTDSGNCAGGRDKRWAGRGAGKSSGRGSHSGVNRVVGASSRAGVDAPGRPRRPLSDLIDYLRACTKTLQEGLSAREDEAMLASRAVEEIGERALAVASDQRGSKVLERLLRKAGKETFDDLFRQLMAALPDLAPNQYASHVLESALASWADRMLSEAEAARPQTEPLIAQCNALMRDGAWPALVEDACASHVARSLVLTLGGFTTGQDGEGKAAVRAGQLPQRRCEHLPEELAESRRAVARVLLNLLQQDETICLSANASPVIQLLVRVLRDRKDRALLNQVCAAIVGAPSEPAGATPDAKRCDSLLHSAAGSRALEAVLETASAEAASSMFTSFFRLRMRAMTSGGAGEFGLYLAQKVADSLRDEPQLMLMLAEVDLATCLSPSAVAPQKVVVVRLLEACLRLQTGFKHIATEVFRALGLRNNSENHKVWPTLLCLEDIGGPEALLREIASESGKNAGGGCQIHAKLRPLPAAGPQLLGLLLRFPQEVVQILNLGLPKLLEHQELLGALAREPRTARVLEAALKSTSALLPKLRMRLTRAFTGSLGGLGPHHVGGWVAAALWRSSLGSTTLRAKFAEELLAVEDELRANNFAVWKVCGLNAAKVRKEEWAEQQQKASKTKRIFSEIIDGGDTEAAQAAQRARLRAAEDAADAAVRTDPTIAGLLPAGEVVDEEEQPDGDGSDPVAATGGGDGEDAELDRLFNKSGGKQRKRHRKEAAAAADEAAAVIQKEQTGCLALKASGDASLDEVLQMISGKAPGNISKKQRKKRRSATAAEARAGAASGSDDDEVRTPSRPGKRAKGPAGE